MRTAEIEIEVKVDELLIVLDNDISHLEESLLRLDELRGLVIKRDEAGLGRLLEGIRVESDSYAANESNRRQIRKELAQFFGCQIEELTLSRLETQLGECKNAEVAARKAQLRSLARKLKTEHLSTAMLLADCARFNRMLLKSILSPGPSTATTYGCDGTVKTQGQTAFMNFQL